MKPPKFPMKFKDFLRHAIGGRLHSEQLHIFRKYWFHMLKNCEGWDGVLPESERPEFFETATEKKIAKLKVEGVEESFFKSHIRDIAAWRYENRIQQRRNAAKKRWQKEKSKNSLDRHRDRQK